MWPFKKKPTQFKVIEREPSQLTLAEWMSDATLVGMAQKVHATTEFKLMLQVLRNESPAFWLLKNATIEDRAAMQARIEGYNLAIANLHGMKRLEKKAQMPVATFEPEELQES